MENAYRSGLDLEGFSQMMKNPSCCYKFYWLEALVILISEGAEELCIEQVIDEMMANAWYSVCQFHIHLSGIQSGQVRDGLERAVQQLAKLSGLPANASKMEIKNAIYQNNDRVRAYKVQLTHMVPYRALAGFFDRGEESVRWKDTGWMVSYISRFDREVEPLPYTLGTSGGLKREVHVNHFWAGMIREHMVPILGWIQNEKVKWLQMNNPEVPGLVYKLAPLDDKMRRLGHVRKLWNGIMSLKTIRDVYTEKPIQMERYAVDHFVPWSFVMNDELWNLMPADPGLNAAKSNHLPRWEPFFKRFAENQYILYTMISSDPQIHRIFKSCFRDNLHSIWASQELYRPGNSKEQFCQILDQNMRPVYDSARRQG